MMMMMMMMMNMPVGTAKVLALLCSGAAIFTRLLDKSANENVSRHGCSEFLVLAVPRFLKVGTCSQVLSCAARGTLLRSL